MKLLLSLFLISSSLQSFSQAKSGECQFNSTPIKYDTCSLLQQYSGEWRYTSGQDTIRIFLKPHRSRSYWFPSVIDNLWGYLEYKHGNNIVVNDSQNRFYNLPYEDDNLNLDLRTILLRSYECNQVSVRNLVGSLIYRLAGSQDYMVKVTINPIGTEMTWHQDFECTIKSDLSIPNNPPTGLNKMPDDFVLIKQP